ncbi:molybdenum cofactor-independent xanthine hydroxylase subunit HpxD [soil metagenome]
MSIIERAPLAPDASPPPADGRAATDRSDEPERRARPDRLTNTDPALRRAWHPVARSGEVTNAQVKVTLLGEDWVLARLGRDRQIAAYVDRCPHRLIPLSAGRVDQVDGVGVLRCGYHGWCFDADGTCVDIPALTTTAHRPARADATTPFAVTEYMGIIWIAPEEPVVGLIDMPEQHDPAFMLGELPGTTAAIGAGLMIENFMDMTHFPFVHAATIGTPEAEKPEDTVVERNGYTMTIEGRHPFPNSNDPGVAAGLRDLIQHRIVTSTHHAPFPARRRVDDRESGATNVILLTVQPIDDDHARVYFSILRNDLDGDPARMAACLGDEHAISTEDLVLQEHYVDKSIPLDLTAEVHLKADRAGIELRRILADLVTSSPAAGATT